VTDSRLGGLVEYVVHASTALNADHDVVFLQEQAPCAFQIDQGVAGSCAGLDPKWKQLRHGTGDFRCVGGNSSLCTQPVSASRWPHSPTGPRGLD